MVQKTPFTQWIEGAQLNPRAESRLFCFPHAGAGPSFYRSWLGSMPRADICLLLLPGRERRYLEKPLTQLSPLVETLAEILPKDKPFAFFGHSMGALVAFELCRELRRRSLQEPTELFVSAHAPPHLLKPRTPPRYLLSDEALIEEIRSFDGTDEMILNDRSLMEMVLPTLRADFQLIETYAYEPEEPLDIPITAMGGELDDEASRDELNGWAKYTNSTFTLRMYPGGHFYLRDLSHLQIRHMFSTLSTRPHPVFSNGF